MEATNLRQGELKVTVTGILSEKSLEQTKDENGINTISGYITLKTGDTSFIRFNVSVKELTKEGKPNGIWPGINTVMNEYKSIADVGEDNADRISVSNGTLGSYHTSNGNDVMSFRSNFFNRVNVDKYEPKAEFSAEVFLSSKVPEMDAEGNETGRLIVKGWGVAYNGVEPFTFIVDKDGADGFDGMYEVGQTVEILGDIVNNRVETVKEIAVAFGKPRREVTTSNKTELIVTGASEPYEEGVTQFAPYPKETIDAAIQERNNRIAEQENQRLSQSNPFTNNSTPSGASKGRALNF